MNRTDNTEFLKRALSNPNGYTIADLFQFTCDRFPQNKALIYVGCENYPKSSITFLELEAAANKVANFFLSKTRKPDTVALIMQNCIEFVLIWLGLCKAGIRIAFINNSIKDDALLHSIKVSNASVLLYGREVSSIVHSLSGQLTLESVCVSPGASEISSPDFRRPPQSVRSGIKFTDVFGYVYTSGTTGLPKAVNVTHFKQWNFARGYGQYGVDEKTVLYSSGMPLYHSSASGIGSGMMFHYGACQILRKKFSANMWLKDILLYKANTFQYIGEICRYILNYTKESREALEFLRANKHKLKLILGTGNGLSGEIWVEFQKLFGIETILEFYGATEGNGAFRNVVRLKDLEYGNTDGVGCIGQVDPYNYKEIFRIVEYDVENDSLRRTLAGELQDCSLGQPGECIFFVDSKNEGSRFVGYTDKKSTEKKIVKEGDRLYIRTGDLLSVDNKGWVRFVDRIGDTFRWRGENVSTTEVGSELSKSGLVAEVNVYGVQIPFVEGRAGCAALVLNARSQNMIMAEFLSAFLLHAKQTLPSYSIPIFVRIISQTDVTGTMKLQKVRLRSEGIDVSSFTDEMYWLDPNFGKEKYERFTLNQYQSLKAKNNSLVSRL